MSSFEKWVVGLSVLSAIGIPLLVVMIKGAMKWTQVEGKLEVHSDKLTDVVTQLTKIADDGISVKADLVHEMNKAHQSIYEQMSVDRKAADDTHKILDDRLRYMEQWWMGQGLKHHFQGGRDD